MQSVSIIGIGRVGGALALALPKDKYQIINLVARSSENAQRISNQIASKPQVLKENDFGSLGEDIVLITTQDSEINGVAQNLAEFKPGKETVVFHTSGSLSSNVLEDLSDAGYFIGSLHPLVSISDSRLGAERIRDAFFSVEGDNNAVKCGNEIARSLGGKPFSIETRNKALYHASAVTACGHLVALLDTAFRMFSKCGLEEGQSKEILMPLIKGTILNLEEQSSKDALTGTFDRVDIETFERHLDVMKRELSVEDVSVYLRLGMQSLALAQEDSENIDRIREMKKKMLIADGALQEELSN